MKNQKTLILTISLMLFSILSFSQRNFNNGLQNCRNSKMLNLSDEQEQKMMEYRLEHRESVMEIKNQIEKNRLELEKMIVSDDISESLLNDITRKNNALHLKIKESRNKMWINVYNILDDNQKIVWKKHLLKKGNGAGFGKGFKHQGYGNKRGRGNGFRDGSCKM